MKLTPLNADGAIIYSWSDHLIRTSNSSRVVTWWRLYAAGQPLATPHVDQYVLKVNLNGGGLTFLRGCVFLWTDSGPAR